MSTSSFRASSSRLPSRALLRVLVVVVLFLGMCAPTVAGQIDPDGIKDAPRDEESDATPDATAEEESPGLEGEGEYVSPQFGTEITWTDAWDLGDMENPLVEFAVGGNFDEPITSGASGDYIWLMDTASESAVVGIFIVPNIDSTPSTIFEIMEEPAFLSTNLFVSEESDTLLLEQTDTSAVILVRDADTPEHHIYLEVVFPEGEDYFYWVGFDMWEPDAYESVFTDVAEGIEIPDIELFSTASTEELLELVNDPEPGNVATPDGDYTPESDATPESDETPEDVTPEVDETPEDDPTEEATEEADETPEDDPTEEATEEVDETPEGDENPGLIAEGEYESPQYGASITWTDAWVLDESRDEPVGINETDAYDWLFLTDAASESTVLYMTVEPLASSDPADILDRITAPGYNEGVFEIDPDSEILLQDSTEDAAAILVVDDSGSEPLFIYLEVHAVDEDGLVVFVDFRAYASDIDEDVLTAIEEDLEVEGQPGLTVFTVDEILAEIEGI